MEGAENHISFLQIPSHLMGFNYTLTIPSLYCDGIVLTLNPGK